MIVRLAAVSAALLLALTACGSDSDDPAGDPPGYADNAGEAGAEQFAGFWVDTLNKATDTGDTEDLKALAGPDCTACGDFATQLDEIYSAGGRVESEGWEIGKIVPEAGATDDKVDLLVTVAISPQQVYPSEDAKPQKFDGGNQGFRMELERTDGEWIVADLTPR